MIIWTFYQHYLSSMPLKPVQAYNDHMSHDIVHAHEYVAVGNDNSPILLIYNMYNVAYKFFPNNTVGQILITRF